MVFDTFWKHLIFDFLFSIFVFSILIFTLWPLRAIFGPFGVQKRRGEVKSVWADPSRAARELLEPSWGRFGRKWVEKGRVWSGKMEPEARVGRRMWPVRLSSR